MSFVLSRKNRNLHQYSLLSNLEDYVEQLKTHGDVIKDDNNALTRFCETFEEILREGSRRSVVVFKKKDYWQWISDIPSRLQKCGSADPKLAYIVNTVDSATKIWPTETKGRQFIRMALVKKVLHVPVEHLAKYGNIMQGLYGDSSFLGTAHLRDSLLELLQEVSKLNFDLNLKALEFLNESWIIPKRVELLTVPCTHLGITISQVNGRAVIAHILPESVGEENNLEVGDCLVSLCEKVCWNQKVGQVVNILKSNLGQPVSMAVVKIKMVNGKLFTALEERRKLLDEEEFFLQKLKQNHNTHRSVNSVPYGYQETPVHSVPKGQMSFDAHFLGKHKTGETGDLTFIGPSISEVLKQENTPMPVLVNLGETNIEIQDKQSNKAVAVHSYTVTSACGRGKEDANVFAYISGDTTCTISRNFTCYVFSVSSEAVAKEAVYGIAQGFGRTLWSV